MRSLSHDRVDGLNGDRSVFGTNWRTTPGQPHSSSFRKIPCKRVGITSSGWTSARKRPYLDTR